MAPNAARLLPKRPLPQREFYAGLVGCGGFVRYAYVPALNRANSPLVVSGLLSRSPESAKRVHGLLGYKTEIFDSFAALAASGIKAVVLTVPHHLHFKYINEAFDHGLDVFCEKPVVNTLAEARALRERVAGGRQLLMVGLNQRYLKRIRQVKELVARGELGQIKSVRAAHNQNIKDLLQGSDWLTDSAKSGGGVVHNAGVHLINVMQHLCGPVEFVRARFENRGTPKAWGEDTAHLELAFKSGVRGTFDASFVGAVDSSYEHLEIEGTLGKLRTEMMTGEIAIFDAEGRRKSVIECRESIPDSVSTELSHFFACVKERRKPETDIDDFIETLKVTLAARLAASEQREVPLAEIHD